MPLPRWKCHKEVTAVKIMALEAHLDKSCTIAYDGGTVKTQAGFMHRFKGIEDDLGYYVRYDDNYESWSPSKVFEEGYTRLP